MASTTPRDLFRRNFQDSCTKGTAAPNARAAMANGCKWEDIPMRSTVAKRGHSGGQSMAKFQTKFQQKINSMLDFKFSDAP